MSKGVRKITAMVTGVAGGGLGEQMIKALKRCKRFECIVVGADIVPLSKGFEDVDLACILPPATSPSYMEQLLHICKLHEVQVLFPGSEAELKVLGQNRGLIESNAIFLPVNSQEVLELCLDKFRTIEFLSSNGFRYPRTLRITSYADIAKVDFLPAVIKPSIGGGGSAHVYLAQDSRELNLYGEFMMQQFGEFIIQEYVGTPESEYTVGVLCSMDGSLINSIAVKRNILTSISCRLKVKNTSGVESLGETLAISSGISQGEIGRFPEVTQTCERMAKLLGARSAINIQCRLFNGEVFVFEINPRFSGTTSLRAMVGYNEPEVLIAEHFFGEKAEVGFAYREGHILRGLSEAFFPFDLAVEENSHKNDKD